MIDAETKIYSAIKLGDRITRSQSQDRGRALSSIPSSDYPVLTGERLIPGVRLNFWLLQALLLAVRSLWLHKAGSRGQKSTDSARWKLMLISDQAKDLVNVLKPGGSISPFQPLVYEPRKVSMQRFMWRRREFFKVIWRCFARFKSGNINYEWSSEVFLFLALKTKTVADESCLLAKVVLSRYSWPTSWILLNQLSLSPSWPLSQYWLTAHSGSRNDC